MINDYLNALRKAVQTNSSGSASLTEYIYAASAGNKDKNSKIEFFLEETNDINNEWIIKQEDPNGNQFLIASPFNNFIRDGFIRKINADFIDNGYDDVTIIEPLKQKTITETSFFMKLPDHILKSVLAKLSNRQLFDILTINKRLTNIICEILYYRPYVSNLQKLQKLEMTLLKSSLNLTKLPYYIYVKRLNFSFFNHLIDRYTLRNVSCCKLVERLTLVNCHGVTGSDVSFFVDSLNNNVLTSLDLSGVTNLNDVTIMALVNKCSVSLQGLYVPNLNCNNKFLIELVKNCFNLKRLRLNNCIPMDNTIAVNISNYLNRLVELDLSGCESINSDSVFQILVKLTNLRDLNLNGCKKLESKFIALLYDANKKLHKLKNLDIGNLNNYSSFKDSDIKKLVSIASNLKHLTLSKHKELTNDSLKYISKLNKTLTTLNIGHLVKITDIGISYLLDCSKLTYLDLSSCERISSDGLISLSVFKRLKRLGLVKCSQLDDYTLLIFLAKTQSKLERVHLSYCQQLTGFSILELLRRHINIQHLSVSGIPAIRSISPLIKKYSRPSPANFTSEQRVSFAIFSG
ncbi:RNI-like protein, partial [Hanseniaspora valbyensis NRRL Y-1626]